MRNKTESEPSDKSFPKQKRLSKKKEISEIFLSGKKIHTALFNLRYTRNLLSYDRCAVLVSRRHGPAVTRNRIKRIFREAVRNFCQTQPPFFDIVIQPSFQKGFIYTECLHGYEKVRCTLV